MLLFLRIISNEDEKSVLCLDAKVESKPQQISIKELKKGWDGTVILLKPRLNCLKN